MTSADYGVIQRWFSTFVSRYASADAGAQRNYDLKVEHTRRVVAIMERLTTASGMGEGDRLLLESVALCHDVGRFPQYERYGTFNDMTSCNHAALAVSTLRREKALAHLPWDEESLILQGVALHNRFQLPPTLPPRVETIARFIRDADKLDIWRVMIDYFTETPQRRASAVVWELPDTGHCTPAVIDEIVAGRVVNRSMLRTADDFKLLQLSWVYDLALPCSHRLLGEFGHIDRLADLLSHDPEAWRAIDAVREFLSQQEHSCVD